MTVLRHRIHLALPFVVGACTLVAGCGNDNPDSVAASPTATSPATSSATALPTAQPARVERDVAYATGSHAQRLDLYLPATPAPHPLLVFVHGGAWLTGDKAGPIAQTIIPVALARGYAVASVNYRLSGEARFPAQVHDVKAAIRWLRAHASSYGLDSSHFAGFGESAGAHTLALVATTQGTSALDDRSLGNAGVASTQASVVLWYPPVDCSPPTTGSRRRRAASGRRRTPSPPCGRCRRCSSS